MRVIVEGVSHPARADADDLHQETFRVVLEKVRAGELREPEKLPGFIRQIAKNLCIADYRKTARRGMWGIGAVHHGLIRLEDQQRGVSGGEIDDVVEGVEPAHAVATANFDLPAPDIERIRQENIGPCQINRMHRCVMLKRA